MKLGLVKRFITTEHLRAQPAVERWINVSDVRSSRTSQHASSVKVMRLLTNAGKSGGSYHSLTEFCSNLDGVPVMETEHCRLKETAPESFQRQGRRLEPSVFRSALD